MVGPDGQPGCGEAVISGGSAKEEHILLSRANMTANGFREQFSQPRPAGENVLVGGKFRAVGKRQAFPRTTVEITLGHSRLPVFAAFRKKAIEHRPAGTARCQKTALWLVNSPMDCFQINLRP